jgi:hypothetical protein
MVKEKMQNEQKYFPALSPPLYRPFGSISKKEASGRLNRKESGCSHIYFHVQALTPAWTTAPSAVRGPSLARVKAASGLTECSIAIRALFENPCPCGLGFPFTGGFQYAI